MVEETHQEYAVSRLLPRWPQVQYHSECSRSPRRLQPRVTSQRSDRRPEAGDRPHGVQITSEKRSYLWWKACVRHQCTAVRGSAAVQLYIVLLLSRLLSIHRHAVSRTSNGGAECFRVHSFFLPNTSILRPLLLPSSSSYMLVDGSLQKHVTSAESPP